jgi:hypothetical protein
MYCVEQKIAKSRWNSTIKGKNRACLAVSSVALAKDEILAEADTSRFVSFATFCENGFLKTSARPAVAPYPCRQVRTRPARAMATKAFC